MHSRSPSPPPAAYFPSCSSKTIRSQCLASKIKYLMRWVLYLDLGCPWINFCAVVKISFFVCGWFWQLSTSCPHFRRASLVKLWDSSGLYSAPRSITLCLDCCFTNVLPVVGFLGADVMHVMHVCVRVHTLVAECVEAAGPY